MSSSGTKTTSKNEKIFTILVFCVIPFILVVMWTTTLINKTRTDECNPLNYKCEAPKTNTGLSNYYSGGPIPSRPTTPTTGGSTPNPSLSPEDQAALNQANKDQNNPSGFADTNKSESTDAICGQPTRIKFPQKNSDYTIAGLRTGSYSIMGIIGFTSLILLGMVYKKAWLFGAGSSSDKNLRHKQYSLYALIALGLVMVIVIPLLNQMLDSPYGYNIAFNISLMELLGAILFITRALTDIDSKGNLPKGAVIIFIIVGILLLLLVVGTIYIHNYQKQNIKEGKISHAINEAIAAMTPPAMSIFVFLGIGAAAYNFTKKTGSKVFAITQVISIILLLACIAMYYDYKTKCDKSKAVCDVKVITKYLDNQTVIEHKQCDVSTGMNITTKTITNMGIAVSVLMGLNNIVGGLAFGLMD